MSYFAHSFVFLNLFMYSDSTQQNIELLVLLILVTLVVSLISRPLRLPYTLVLVIAGLIIGVSPLLPNIRLNPDVVLFLFLPALLFEGAWNVDVEELLHNWLIVLIFAVPGLLLSLFIVAALLHWTLGLPWLLMLLLGAMVSPTDPIAVLTLFRQMGLSDRLRTIVEGESLFNDGVGAAVFGLVLAILVASTSSSGTAQESSLFLTILEVLWLMLGGLGIGVGIGIIAAHLLRLVEDHLIEMTVTISVAYCVYLLGVALHTSGLLAVVGAGLVLGSYGRRTGLSERAQQTSHDIWEFLGYLANSLLFLLLGIQIGEGHLLQALPAIALTLVAVLGGRATMVYLLVPLYNAFARYRSRKEQTKKTLLFSWTVPIPRGWRPVLLMSGLRGALSVALVLSLPSLMPERALLENTVYGVVLVTLLGQGLGLRVLLPHLQLRENIDSNNE